MQALFRVGRQVADYTLGFAVVMVHLMIAARDEQRFIAASSTSPHDPSSSASS
jgi:hypothetical protein